MDSILKQLVMCEICGFEAIYLARHFKDIHNMSSAEYRTKYPGARIRSEAQEAHRKAVFKVTHANPSHKGKKKTVTCVCGTTGEIPLSVSAKLFKCPTCKAEIEKANKETEDAKFALLTEGKQYVRCVGCDYRAENLNSHVQSVHPEWVGRYPGQMTALESSIRDKSFNIGKKHTSETLAKMSANAGRWNKGHTLETDPRLAFQHEAIVKYFQENSPWNKGLTKQTDPKVKASSEKQAAFWQMNPRSSEPKVVLTKEDFQPYLLGNGKVKLGRAIAGLGYCYITLVRICERLGLETHNTSIKETACLDSVSKVLGEAPYEQEWSSDHFRNPLTGGRFRYDGYFPQQNLMVEFHGSQHWVFPSVYIKDEEQFKAQQERDRIKEELVRSRPGFHYLAIREDEPYTDPEYLRYRLEDEGIL